MDYRGYRGPSGLTEVAPISRPLPRRGEAVKLTADLEGITTSGGLLISPDRLGPGLVEQIALDGTVCVHWLGADIQGCLPPEDLLPFGAGSHIVTVVRCTPQGQCSLAGYKLVLGLGFDHNWTVELRPGQVVRAMRDDGLKWTFERNPLFNSIKTFWPQPPDDDDAEALTAAELALSRKKMSVPAPVRTA